MRFNCGDFLLAAHSGLFGTVKTLVQCKNLVAVVAKEFSTFCGLLTLLHRVTLLWEGQEIHCCWVDLC